MSANGFKLLQGGCGVAQDGRKIPENRAVSEGNGFGSTITLYHMRTALSEDPDTSTPRGGTTRRLFTKSVWACVVESTFLVCPSIYEMEITSIGKRNHLDIPNFDGLKGLLFVPIENQL
jgi:hypothetical protein